MRYFIIISILTFSYSANCQVNTIDSLVNGIDKKEKLNGVILVAKDGEIIYHKSFGNANLSLKVKTTIDSKYLIGSVSKQFTAMLVLQLVQDGKIQLDDPIIKYLPSFRNDTGKRISIRHLLTHTHGIPNAELEKRYMPMTTDEFLREYCEIGLEFDPGSNFKYSEVVGYYILGVILEKVSGKSYGEFLDERILKPLGMKNTGYVDSRRIIENMATGYSVTSEGKFENAPHWDVTQSFSAAGIYSSTTDLFIWDRSLRTEKILKQEYLDMMFTPFNDKVRYGFGWHINNAVIEGKERLFPAHGGGANGYRAAIMRGLQDDAVVIYLSNTDKYVEVRYPVFDQLFPGK